VAYREVIEDGPGAKISSVGTVLATSRGLLFFKPFANEFDPLGYANFSYKFRDPVTGLESSEVTVSFAVSPVNDAPRALPLSVSVNKLSQDEVTVRLDAIDNDVADPLSMSYAPSFSDTLYSKITVWPVFGDVLQVPDRAPILSESENYAFKSSYASQVDSAPLTTDRRHTPHNKQAPYSGAATTLRATVVRPRPSRHPRSNLNLNLGRAYVEPVEQLWRRV
jgi:hypothetical protein